MSADNGGRDLDADANTIPGSERIGERFRLRLGKWRDEPVGPYQQAIYKLASATGLFATGVLQLTPYTAA